jgi:hypothetical protein
MNLISLQAFTYAVRQVTKITIEHCVYIWRCIIFPTFKFRVFNNLKDIDCCRVLSWELLGASRVEVRSDQVHGHGGANITTIL